MINMIRLRPYKKCDAEKIISWIENEEIFMLWGGNRFGEFPITADVINKKYFADNGDCAEADNFYPMTAFTDDGAVGHFIMRYINGDNKVLRFGWVIIDSGEREKGYGRKMLSLGLKYAFDILKVGKVTIGVYENNISAYKCYKSVGFHETAQANLEIGYDGQRIVELEINENDYRTED